MSVPQEQLLADQVLELSGSAPKDPSRFPEDPSSFPEDPRRGLINRTPAVDVQQSSEMRLADQVLAISQQQEPGQSQEEDTLGSRVSSIAEEKNKELTKTLADVATGEISPFTGIVQYAGKSGKGALDIAGEAITTAVGPTFKAILPHLLPVEAIKDKTSDFLDTEMGKAGMEALNNGMEDYSNFKKLYPQAAKTLESVVDIALFVTPAKVKATAKPASKTLTAVEKKIAGKAGRQEIRSRKKFIDDLVRPAQTKKVKESQVGRTDVVGEGIFEKSVIRPSWQEKDIGAYVGTVKGLSPKNSLQKNYNLIQDKVGQLEERLIASLTKPKTINGKSVYRNGEPVSQFVLVENPSIAIRNGVKEYIKNNPTVRADMSLKRLAIEYARSAETIIAKYPNTPHGLLMARREFDSLMKSIQPKTFADPKMTPHVQTAFAIRDSMNDLIARSAPTEAIRETLKHQSKLLKGMSNLEPKVAKQGASAIRRTWDNAVRVVPWRSRAIQESALLMGTTALYASQIVSPYVSIGGAAAGTAYIAGRWVVSAQAKRTLAGLLKLSNKALGIAKDPAMLHQLRADRAVLVNMLESAEFVTDEEFESISSQNTQDTPQVQEQ